MIYFAQPVGGGPVKIGTSTNVGARIGQLESHYGKSLVLLATMPGGFREESEIHARFSHLRLKREGTRGKGPEQFEPTAEIAEFIGCDLVPCDTVTGKTVMLPAPYEPKPKCVAYGPDVAANIARLGYADVVIKTSEVARVISRNTGKKVSRQRITSILNAVRLSRKSVESLAKGLGVSPAELLKGSKWA